MKNLLALILTVGILIAGCSQATPAQIKNQAVANSTSALKVANPTVHSGTEANPNSLSKPMNVTVNPPHIPVNSFSGGAANDWKTFSSVELGVAVDYPSDWALTEQTDGARFTSQQGSLVILKVTPVDNVKNSGQCATLLNSQGLSIDACSDISSNTYSASFNLGVTNRSMQWAVLYTNNQDSLNTYRLMIDTLRTLH